MYYSFYIQTHTQKGLFRADLAYKMTTRKESHSKNIRGFKSSLRMRWMAGH